MGLVILMALFGFFGCAKKGQVPLGPDEVEVVEVEEVVRESVPSEEGAMEEASDEGSASGAVRAPRPAGGHPVRF